MLILTKINYQMLIGDDFVFLIIFILILFVICICLDIRDKKQDNNPPSSEFADMAHLSYEEKIRKYRDEYDDLSPTLRNRL